jgi:serine/threonine protein kinase
MEIGHYDKYQKYRYKHWRQIGLGTPYPPLPSERRRIAREGYPPLPQSPTRGRPELSPVGYRDFYQQRGTETYVQDRDADRSEIDTFADEPRSWPSEGLGDSFGLRKRYKAVSVLGAGAFGVVLRVRDRKDGIYRAMKVLRNDSHSTSNGYEEISILSELSYHDPDGRLPLVKITSHFLHPNPRGGNPNLCVVMDLLGPSLLDSLEREGPFSLNQVADIVSHLCEGLHYLHHVRNYVHTDLKVENIVLASPDPDARAVSPLRVKIIDMGNLVKKRPEGHHQVAFTDNYRPPESFLGRSWSTSGDIWSVGCIVFELLVGDLLIFDNLRQGMSHLDCIEMRLGPIPGRAPYEGGARVESMATELATKAEFDPREVPLVLDFLGQLLRYDPAQRPEAREMCRHPLIVKYKTQ